MVRLLHILFASLLSTSSCLTIARDTEVNFTMHVLLGRALFDYQDHVARVNAIQDTWGKDHHVHIHVLNFGFERFEEQYRNWCTEKEHCPLDAYKVADGELEIPEVTLRSPLWNLDGHVWALRRALEDPRCQWLLLGQDMISLHMKNLKRYLKHFDPQDSLVLGNRLRGYGASDAKMASPWGYILSRGAAHSLVKAWDGKLRDAIKQKPSLSAHGGSTDYGFGYALQQLQPPAKFIDTRDSAGQDRMFLWPPSRIDRDDWWDSWYPGLRIDKPKKSVSPESFLFFFAGPKEIRQLGAFFEYGGSLDSFLASEASGSHSDHDGGVGMYTTKTWRMLDSLRGFQS